MKKIKGVLSLEAQLQSSMLFSCVLLGTIGVFFASIITFKLLFDYSIQSVHDNAMAVSEPIADGIFASNKSLVDESLNILMKNSLICQVIAESLNKDFIDYVGSPICISDITINLYSPFNHHELVGVLHVGVNHNIIKQKIFLLIFIETVLVLFVLVVAVFSIWLSTSQVIINPLLKLIDHLHNIDPHNNELLPIPKKHFNNEFGYFVSDINKLINFVYNKHAEKLRVIDFISDIRNQYQSIFENARTGIALIDQNGRCVLANPSVANMLHLDIVVEGPFCVLNNFMNNFGSGSMFSDLMQNAILTNVVVSSDIPVSFDNSIEDYKYWLNVSISSHNLSKTYINDPTCQLLECIIVDINERKRIEEETRFKAEHDLLTGLHNRSSGITAIELCINTNSEANRNGVILMMDLDRFKLINDTHGHQAGDNVLIEISKRLSQTCRTSDVICRLGGDEFLIGLFDIGFPVNLENILSRLIMIISKPIEVGKEQFNFVGASIGAAIIPLEGEINVSELMSHADAAMYRVKRAGRFGYCIHDGNSYLNTVQLSKKE